MFFAAAGLVGAAVQLRARGLAAAGDAAVTLYVAALMLYGVFANAWGTTRFRLALYAGIVLWGLADYATGTVDDYSWLLLGGGTALLAWTLTRTYRDRTTPVYD